MRKNKLKIPIAVLLILLFILQMSVLGDSGGLLQGQEHTYQQSALKLKVNGTIITPDVPPLILENRTMIPLRAVLEQFGAACSFFGEKQLVTVVLNDQKLELTINSTTAKLNDTKQLTMEVPARIINDRTMIPLRFVSESLGLIVNWDPNTATASVDPPAGGIPNVANLTGIALETGENSSRVVITADGDIANYKAFTLDNPSRIVLDITHANKNTAPSSITAGAAGVTGVRSSQFTNYPAVTRVVVDLSQAADFVVTNTVDRKTVAIDIQCGSSGVTPTPTPPIVTPTPTPPPTDTNGLPALSSAAKNKLVVLDAGHGGTDPGSIGYDDNGNIIAKEAEITLAVTKRVNAYLQAAGVKTKLTRETDVLVPLMDIPKIANDANADLFLSIHCNSLNGTPSANGTETLYLSNAANPAYGISGIRFAEIVQKEMISVLGTTDRGLKERPNLVVLKYTNMPAALAEMAFISNPSDRAKLMSADYQDKVAKALSKAVILALNESVK